MIIDVVVFVLVLGVLVFFHELGHFLAAKACGIYVDRFSLGMPPRVFGIRFGETDYCIGALPIGGYVKMAGQEDSPLTDEERQKTYGHVPSDRWFSNKPVWQRFIVIFSGPLMNLVLAILLYAVVAAVGAEVPETEVDNRVGFVEPGSPASAAPLYAITDENQPIDFTRPADAHGWQTGDRIVSIEGEVVRNTMDVALSAALGTGKVLTVRVDRPNADGTVTRYVSLAEPQPIKGGQHARFGVNAFETALVDDVMEDGTAKASGIQRGDILVRANGKLIDRDTFTRLVEQTPEGQSLDIELLRGAETLHVSVAPARVGRFLGYVFGANARAEGVPPDDAQPVVAATLGKAEEDRLLLPGDVIEKVDGQPATLSLLRQVERSRPGDTISMEVKRPAVFFGLLRKEMRLTAQVPSTPVGAIGIFYGTKMVFHRVPTMMVLPEACRLGYQAVERTIRTLVLLITGDVSPKELGGPVMIYQITTSAARLGYWWLFNFTAFISANLCVFNLLPLPVLDGGLMLYLAIEGIRRKPLNIRVLERIQQVGLVLIIALLVYVTANDIKRWIASQLP